MLESKVMENYQGEIIEESLGNKAVLKKMKILSKRIERITDKHKTPWLKQWTLDFIEIEEKNADDLTNEISKSFDSDHSGSWYADFKNDLYHYIIFPNKVFFIDRTNKSQYNDATKYGISLGIPDYQVDFSPNIKNWQR